MKTSNKQTERLSKLDNVLSQLSDVLLDPSFRSELSPFFFNWLGLRVASKEGIQYELNVDSDVFNHLDMKNKRVLEIGCGFGLRLIVFALLGAKKCVGIDISPEMIGDLEKLSGRFAVDVEAICGDFLEYNFAEENFDIVIVNETISHVRDTPRLLRKTKKIVTLGGRVWIKDCNNGLFLPKKIEVWRKWKKVEHGPKTGVSGREVDRLSFFDARVSIIHHHDSSLDEHTVRRLAKKTQGMFGEDLITAVEEYKKEKKISKKPSFRYRNPYTGEYPELCFNPRALVKELAELGFKCRLIPPSETRPETNIFAGRGVVQQSLLKMYMRLVTISPAAVAILIYPCFTICARKPNWE
jgi:SAM-dependent methyltransferase